MATRWLRAGGSPPIIDGLFWRTNNTQHAPDLWQASSTNVLANDSFLPKEHAGDDLLFNPAWHEWRYLSFISARDFMLTVRVFSMPSAAGCKTDDDLVYFARSAWPLLPASMVSLWKYTVTYRQMLRLVWKCRGARSHTYPMPPFRKIPGLELRPLNVMRLRSVRHAVLAPTMPMLTQVLYQ